MPTYTSHYPPVQDAAHVKATSYSVAAPPWRATDPTVSLVGPSDNAAWSTPANPSVPQKFTIDHGEPFVAARMYLENQHYSGSYTYNRLDQSEIYGTNSATAFANVSAPTDLTDLTLLGTFTARAHVSSNISDPQYFLLTGNKTPFRYTVLRALNLAAGASTIVFRRIEIQSDDEAVTTATITNDFSAPYRGSSISLVSPVVSAVTAPYRSAKEINAPFFAPYRSAKEINAPFFAPYRSAWMVASPCVCPYQSTLPANSESLAPYRAIDPVSFAFFAPYSARDPHPVDMSFSSPYRGKDTQPVAAAPLFAPYRSMEAVSLPPADVCKVIVNGVAVDPIRLSITWSRQQAAIEAELEFADASVYVLANRHAPAEIDLWGYHFDLVVDGRSRHEEFGQWSCTVRLASPSVKIEYPWAEKVEGELTGLASEIAQSLAGSIPVSWHTVDWYIMPGRWIAASEPPLSLLQKLASAVGAIILPMPDGSISVQPLYPVPVPEWAISKAEKAISTVLDVFSIETSGEHKDGLNSIQISDQEEAADTIRIEEDTDKKLSTTTQVLVYQTPWTDDFSLTHRGDDSTARIAPMGIEERTIIEEEILVQDGNGSAAYPVYAILAAKYNKLNLGTPTYSEDGSVKPAIEGDSILLLSYKTRARRYSVSEMTMADLLLVAENSKG